MESSNFSIVKHIHLNQLDDKKKKNFKNRVIISVFIVIFYLLVLTFAVLADQTDAKWTSFSSSKINGIFAILLSIIMYVPFFFCVLEVTRLVFKKNDKTPTVLLLVISSLVFFLSVFPYLFTRYFVDSYYSNLDFENETSYILFYVKSSYTIILTCIASFVFLIITLNIILKVFHKANFKNVITSNILLFIVIFGFVGFVLIALVKGWVSLLFLLISVLATDVFCYIWGLLFGKHKMAKIVSPNKTWEGAFLGLVSAILFLMIYCFFITLDKTQLTSESGSYYRWEVVLQNIVSFKTFIYNSNLWLVLVLVSIILVVFSILGDLLFSYVKRNFGTKDFSNYLKSHGGFLDRVDALLVSSLAFSIYSLIAIAIYSFANFELL